MRIKNYKIFFIIMIILIIISYSLYKNQKQNTVQTEKELKNKCSNLTINETAKCLIQSVKPIFNYTSDRTWSSNLMTYEFLKINGGDCEDWSNFYSRMAHELGFQSQNIRYGGIKEVVDGHQFAVIWDDYTYCWLDQTKYECHKRIE